MLESIKGIGSKTIGYLNKLGIYNIDDLMNFYPFRYDVIERSNLDSLSDNSPIIIDGIIESIPSVFFFNKKMNKMTFKINCGTRLFNITIFNRAYMKNNIKIGGYITVIGKYDLKHNNIVANNIILSLIDKPRIEPVYHTTYGITESKIKSIIQECQFKEFKCIDYVPEYLCEKYNFKDKKSCILEVHFPTNKLKLKNALNRLKYEELLIFMLKMEYLKNNSMLKYGLKRNVEFSLVEQFIKELPFELTIDQMNSVKDIYSDLVSEYRMNRLLQGDVGSGKTIVSFIAMYINYLSGYQSALMAPTEILAQQHYNNILSLFKGKDINIKMLSGKMKARDKKEVLDGLKSGSIDIVIGTHALFTDNVIYKNLGLVITDEQHRFGVNQRGNLKNKGILCDVLYMSATPIPRTYALTLYGDMTVSSIMAMPNGRKPIKTYIKSESQIKEVLEAMYKELKNGHQIYVIAPLIEESDKIDLNDVYKLEENMNKAFGKLYKIGVLHGKMKEDEKNSIMQSFKNNEIQILISTTVIEVGIDVGNATMMVIFDAYRFGLSALHQLRGRVGRGNLESSCYLISNSEVERLKILESTCDGFKISAEDFRLRGSGDLFGIKQSGDMSFRLADIKRDYNILLKAKEDAQELINNRLYKYGDLDNLINNMNLD